MWNIILTIYSISTSFHVFPTAHAYCQKVFCLTATFTYLRKKIKSLMSKLKGPNGLPAPIFYEIDFSKTYTHNNELRFSIRCGYWAMWQKNHRIIKIVKIVMVETQAMQLPSHSHYTPLLCDYFPLGVIPLWKLQSILMHCSHPVSSRS